MKVGEFAQRLGVTTRMLRHYEQEGLLAPAARDTNGYREYTDDQLAGGARIRDLMAAGVPARLARDLLDVTTDVRGDDEQHVDPQTRAELEEQWQRMCRCIDCITARRDALRGLLDSLAVNQVVP